MSTDRALKSIRYAKQSEETRNKAILKIKHHYSLTLLNILGKHNHTIIVSVYTKHKIRTNP